MRDFLPVFGSVLVWAIAPILITIVGKAGFDPYTQTFYRYAAAAAFFLAIAAASDRPGLAAAFRAWRRTGAMALAVVAFQLTSVNAIYFTGPTIAGFAGHLSIVFALAGGAVLFADEREVVLSWRFLVGAAVVVAAAGGVVLGGEVNIEGGPVRGGGVSPGLTGLGLLCLLTFPAAWATFSLLIKRFVGYERRPEATEVTESTEAERHGKRRRAAKRLPSVASVFSVAGRSPGRAGLLRPVPAFAVTMAEATLIVLAVTAAFGDLGHIADVSGKIVLMLVVSGLACVGVGQALYWFSIGRIGVAMSQTVTRATPFLTGLFSFALLGERMGAFQWACGAVLVAGVVYLIKVRVAGQRTAAG